MYKATGKFRILLVGASPLLEVEALGLDHPGIAFLAADPVRVAASRETIRDCDLLVVNLDLVNGLDLLANLCSRPAAPPVIGVGSRSHGGRSLEHVLLLAELRGAAAALPGPIDAVELALIALDHARVPGFGAVTSELERRLAC
jgi:hypothetical protein